jgi:hypothetical protein
MKKADPQICGSAHLRPVLTALSAGRSLVQKYALVKFSKPLHLNFRSNPSPRLLPSSIPRSLKPFLDRPPLKG